MGLRLPRPYSEDAVVTRDKNAPKVEDVYPELLGGRGQNISRQCGQSSCSAILYLLPSSKLLVSLPRYLATFAIASLTP